MAQQALAGVGKARSHRGPLYECRACPVLCDKRSMVTHIVAKHLQVREAPYFCTVCDTKYVGRRDWERHRTDAHHRARCAMRPKLAKGCMGINPDGVALEGPSARAISLPKEEADHYWALVAAAKDAPLDLDKDSSSSSESEEEPDQPAPQGGDGPHQPDRTTPDHFVFDVSHQEEITTPSREVPAMTEDLESTPGSSKSPRTGKASSPPPVHSQKRKKSVASTVAPVVATAVPLAGTSSTAQSHESDDMSSPPPPPRPTTLRRGKRVCRVLSPLLCPLPCPRRRLFTLMLLSPQVALPNQWPGHQMLLQSPLHHPWTQRSGPGFTHGWRKWWGLQCVRAWQQALSSLGRSWLSNTKISRRA